MLKYAVVGLAILGGCYGLHKATEWAERRGWIYYRTKRGSSGVLENAFLEVQSIIDPPARHVLEEGVKDDREDDENGGPPDAGKSDERRIEQSPRSDARLLDPQDPRHDTRRNRR